MSCHTLTECAKLANVSRRTIQRYVKSGKLSYRNNEQGNPVVDLSELIRVFGEVSHPQDSEMSHPVTVTNQELSDLIEQATQKANQSLVQEIKELRKEVQSLRLLTYQSEAIEVEVNESNITKQTPNSDLDDIPDLFDYFNKK